MPAPADPIARPSSARAAEQAGERRHQHRSERQQQRDDRTVREKARRSRCRAPSRRRPSTRLAPAPHDGQRRRARRDRMPWQKLSASPACAERIEATARRRRAASRRRRGAGSCVVAEAEREPGTGDGARSAPPPRRGRRPASRQAERDRRSCAAACTKRPRHVVDPQAAERPGGDRIDVRVEQVAPAAVHGSRGRRWRRALRRWRRATASDDARARPAQGAARAARDEQEQHARSSAGRQQRVRSSGSAAHLDAVGRRRRKPISRDSGRQQEVGPVVVHRLRRQVRIARRQRELAELERPARCARGSRR